MLIIFTLIKCCNTFNIPIFLTLFRLVMVPCFTIVFYLPVQWGPILCTIIFITAAITDWFDGFLARRWKQTSKIGKFLDPVVDKIMIITAFVLISEYFHVWWMTLPISSMIIREIIISALREWIAKIYNHRDLSVSWLSKLKTFIQMSALIVLLCRFNEWTMITGIVALYVSVVLALWSLCYYLYTACCIIVKL
ncbi:CDP-diacylglycerol--glycerol-3-phosphate 3-phosphatidyltransferase [Candidatus Blochmanniella vafra str. BVAF]|uniref:CDP-diacylglycerol--glycerol-3-phosphate 3-phosphatidyltransferase n=1 Tax=Blochmanniella vafra (strain BVAF) TaxID=859654 RepID=E8Q6B3_BLOVB|nr:CDP-diacylglycerol--glycerol-3-phosphate 3-phosphatidyltransferase [Candidatus Blochmannia vafer]ADV33807.1 CDP-diacylglycerol--glycerol-3-phosphate 3-phosphatidyltransferase [Candidatus Blochmannia vafer str. BVAF]